jgi:Protein of unknown function (DUF3108)
MTLINHLNSIKKPLFLFAFIATMAFMPHFASPQYPTEQSDTTTSSHTVVNNAFQNGEELVYKIYYNLNFVWIPAGEVVFHVNDEGSRYHLSAEGKTYSSYEWFYKAYNKLDSYVDKNTLLPQTSIRWVKENRYKLYDKVQYDQKNRTAQYERGDTKDAVEKRGSIKLTDAMHDLLSAIYYSRTLDYTHAKVGQDFPMKVMLDEETFPLKYRYMGKEEKNIRGLGKYSTMKFVPQLVAGNVFKENSQMKIWSTDDGNKLPLMIESPVAVGSVKVVLKSYKGLKYNLDSKKD